MFADSLVLLGDVKMTYGTVRIVRMAFSSVGDFQSTLVWIFIEKGYAIMDSLLLVGVGVIEACEKWTSKERLYNWIFFMLHNQG